MRFFDILWQIARPYNSSISDIISFIGIKRFTLKYFLALRFLKFCFLWTLNHFQFSSFSVWRRRQTSEILPCLSSQQQSFAPFFGDKTKAGIFLFPLLIFIFFNIYVFILFHWKHNLSPRHNLQLYNTIATKYKHNAKKRRKSYTVLNRKWYNTSENTCLQGFLSAVFKHKTVFLQEKLCDDRRK